MEVFTVTLFTIKGVFYLVLRGVGGLYNAQILGGLREIINFESC
jgi:hypothetical protein